MPEYSKEWSSFDILPACKSRVESSLASSATLIPRLNKANPQFIHHIALNWADASVKSIDMSLNLKEHYSRCEPPSLHLQEIIRRFKVKLWKWRKDETHKLNFTFVAFLPHLPPISRLWTPLPTLLVLALVCLSAIVGVVASSSSLYWQTKCADYNKAHWLSPSTIVLGLWAIHRFLLEGCPIRVNSEWLPEMGNWAIGIIIIRCSSSSSIRASQFSLEIKLFAAPFP